MGRTHVRRRAVTVLAAAISLAILAGPGALATLGPNEAPRAAAVLHVVQPGDTLWALAVRFGGGRDPRVVVDSIEAANALEAPALVPGQLLRIPLDA